MAFVSAGDIVITGVVDGSADGAIGGPGALTCDEKGGGGASFTIGAFSRHTFGPLYPTFILATNGSGGGGWGSAGGDGGTVPVFEDRRAVGGPSVPGDTLVPIRGGCQGGGENLSYRGGGGGALQFVSATEIRLVSLDGSRKGTIHVGGGGGTAGLPLGRNDIDDPIELFGSGGGGSGGSILIEAPSLRIEPGTALFAGGGGGGGYGACSPPPHGLDAAPGRTFTGGSCDGQEQISAGGDGGNSGEGAVGDDAPDGPAGSGGGGLGRIRLNDRDGRADTTDGSVVGILTTGRTGRH